MCTVALFQVLAVCIASIAPCADDEGWATTYDPEPNTAKMTITVFSAPGDTKTVAEYNRGNTSLRCNVNLASNRPTKERKYVGSFHPIYLLIAGKSHSDPKTLCDEESLLKALKSIPAISVTEIAETVNQQTVVTRFEITFGKPQPK